MGTKLTFNAVVLALLSISQAASADTISIDGSIAGNTLLDAGNHDGLFDGSSVLPAHFSINSASFSFVFQDNQDLITSAPAVTTSENVGSYVQTTQSYSGWDWYTQYHRTATAYQTVQQHGEAEAVEVKLSGVSVGSGATNASLSTTTTPASFQYQSLDSTSGYPGYSYSYRCGNYTCGGYSSGSWSYYYTDHFTETTAQLQDYTGGFSINGNIDDASILRPLLTGGQLPFSLAVNGNLQLVSARLNLDISPTAAVPEPTTTGLILAGFGVLGLRRIRTKSRD